MVYCNSCSGFTTLRYLLEQSYSAVTNGSESRDPRLLHAVPNFYVLKEDFGALKTSAQAGCELCSLIASNPALQFRYLLQDGEISEEESNRLGPVTIGTRSWYYDPRGHSAPRIEVNAGRLKGGDEDVTVCELEVFAKRGDKNPEIEPSNMLLREVMPHSGDIACLSIAKDWLHRCKEQHVRCQQSMASKDFPARLIDVGTDVTNPKLIFPSNFDMAYIKWAALSYCWGGNSPFILTKATFDELRRGLPLASFPNTLRDAVLVSRSLDIPCIWIDALCIFQDSKEDWSSEAPKMGSIYRNAEVVIAATLAPSSNFGILQPRPQNGSCGVPWMMKPDAGGTRSDLGSDGSIVYLRPETAFQEGPLEGRGWTFQETMLATRTISFLQGQMAWTCLEYSEAEDGRVEIQDMVFDDGSVGMDYTKQILARGVAVSNSGRNSHKISKPNVYAMWDHVLLVYSMRSLTYATDRLLAISSLAAAFNNFLNDQYYAGIWSGDMIRGLLWSPIPPYPREVVESSGKGEYIAPSWSWASLTVGQLRCVSNSSDFKAIANVKEVRIENEGPDPYGQVKSGWLQLEAPFKTLKSLHSDQTTSCCTSAFEVFTHRLFDDSAGFAAYEFELQHRPEPSQRFAAVQIASTCYEEAGRKRVECTELLFLESAGLNSSLTTTEWPVYRRVASSALRWTTDMPVDRDAPPRSQSISPNEARAWLELRERPWPVVDVIIV